MAFTASKQREKRAPAPVGRGKPLIPSVGIEVWYRDQMNGVVTAMVDDYRKQMSNALKAPDVEKYFAQDAAATDALKGVLNRLNRKWKSIFEGFAQKVAPEFTDKMDDQAKASTLNSLKVAGIEAPRDAYNSNIANTLGAAKDFNHTLITSIQKEAHEKVYESVMLSLTSPDPEKQGQSGIENALREMGGFSKKRVKLIARDQTSKLYASLSDERLAQNGIEEFEWAHSSAGKVPRKTHVDKDGQIFKLNDPRLWEGPKSDQGPPGWAINCRCRKIPIIR